ncbi:MAG: glycosyltransferase [Paludibacteraceae bacterium]
MNILFVTDTDISPISGGVERVVYVLSYYLTAKYNVCCHLAYTDKSKVVTNDNVFVSKYEIKHDDGIENMKQYMEEANIDIVFSNMMRGSSLSRIMPVLGNVSQQLNITHIATFHNMPSYELVGMNLSILVSRIFHGNKIGSLLQLGKQIVVSLLGRKLATHFLHKKYRCTYDNVDKLYLLDENYIPIYSSCANVCISDKFGFMPNALPFQYTKAFEDIDQKEKIVLIVSRLEEKQKRLSVAFKIWKQVERSGDFPDWKLVVVGSGEDETIYRKMLKKMNMKNVKMVGCQESLPYYQRASIFMMTSAYEGFPMVLVEAQQMGVVPIAFDSFSAVNSVLSNNKTGVIVPNNDELSYLNSLTETMRNVGFRRKMAVACICASEAYSLEKIAHRWMNIFESVSKK